MSITDDYVERVLEYLEKRYSSNKPDMYDKSFCEDVKRVTGMSCDKFVRQVNQQAISEAKQVAPVLRSYADRLHDIASKAEALLEWIKNEKNTGLCEIGYCYALKALAREAQQIAKDIEYAYQHPEIDPGAFTKQRLREIQERVKRLETELYQDYQVALNQYKRGLAKTPPPTLTAPKKEKHTDTGNSQKQGTRKSQANKRETRIQRSLKTKSMNTGLLTTSAMGYLNTAGKVMLITQRRKQGTNTIVNISASPRIVVPGSFVRGKQARRMLRVTFF